MGESNFIIELNHISKCYGEKCVLDDVSLFVKKGEFVTILGPSGCGKTTLLKILAGFGTATSGEIKIAGTSVISAPAILISPDVAVPKPANIFKRVVLPQPEGPRIVTNSPFFTNKLTSSKTCFSPKLFEI